MIPFYLSIQLAIAYLLSSKIFVSLPNQRQKLWQFILVILISGGILSCVISSQSESSWTKRTNSYNRQFAQLINQASHPLLLSELSRTPPYHSIFKQASLSHSLERKVQFQFIVENTLPDIPQGFNDVFLIDPSEELKGKIETRYSSKLKLISRNSESMLWMLDKN
jgi:uncharacterized membrane protein